MKMKKWKYFEDAEFVFNGGWNDPHLKYKGERLNYYFVEDAIYENFKDFASEQNIEVNEENFVLYCKEHQDTIRDVFETVLLVA